ncbi:MAG: hypothetical protein J5I93_25865 [Pirellulaceae bacterium]|nr:hypothetical protein [Pirellulaceae bacterium]
MAHHEMNTGNWLLGFVRSPQRRKDREARRQRQQRRRMFQGFESLEERRLLATLSFDTNSNTLIYRDTLGEVNNVQYTFNDLGSTKEFTFTDTALIINSTGCGAPAGTTIICSTLPQTAAVRFELGTNNDTLILNASRIAGGNAGAEDIAIAPAGAGQRVTGFDPGVPVDITGTEIIRFVGNGNDDSLTVNPGSGNDTVRIQNANPNTDVVQSSSLPNIEFTGMAAFELNANAGAGNGSDTITIETRDLEGATASNYTVATDASDTLIIEGQGSNDAYNLDDPDGLGPQAARIIDFNGNNVQVTVVSDDVGLVRFDTLGGADSLDVDVTNTNLLVEYNGGAGTTDSLFVFGSGVTNQSYTVGPAVDEGTLEFDGLTFITFTGLEPILDLVTATNLTVNATGAGNAISYTNLGADGVVAVDAFETLQFNNKKHLTLNGLGGVDTFSIGTAAGLDPDGSITVNSGDAADSVLINATTAQDPIHVDNLDLFSARILGAQPVPIQVVATETLTIDGQTDNDALTVHGTNTDDTATVTPGLPVDSGVIQVNSLLAVNYRGIGTGGTLTFAGNEGSNDRLVYNGTALLDSFNISATTGSVDLVNAFGVYPQLQQIGVERLDIAAGGDSDQFTVNANQPYTRIQLDGGVGADSVTLNGNSLNNAVVDFSGSPATVAGAGLGVVALPGVEIATVNNTNSGVIINGGSTINVLPTSTNAARVVVDGGIPEVRLTATSLAIDGLGGNDTLTVSGTPGNDIALVTPGASTDAGSIAVNDLLPVDFRNLGAGGALVFAAGAGTDELVYHATAGDDAFLVASTGDVTLVSPLGMHLIVRETDVEDLSLNGLDGDDAFTVNPGHGYRSVNLSGGTPDAGSDSATLNGDGTPVTATLGISPATVAGGGLGVVSLTGVETAAVNNVAGPVNVNGGPSADRFDVTPLDFDSARVQANGASPVVTANTFGPLAISAAGSTNNTLAVHLSTASETVTVDDNEVTVTAGAVLKQILYSNTNVAALAVYGNEGNDTFNFTPSVNSPEILIDGGDPIGVVGDTLNLLAIGPVTFAPGPESDEGGFQTPGVAEVSFDHIERVNIDLTNAGGIVTVCGTGDDDQITAAGVAPNTVNVQVNDGPLMQYAGVNTLNLQGKNGDDDIDIDLIANLGVNFNVDGGLPTVDGDTLTITGTDAADTASWVPSGPDGGTMIAVATLISVTTTETVVYDGRDGGDSLGIVGTPQDDNYAYSPAGVGTGSMTSDGAPAFSFLGVDDLTVSGGAGGFDRLAITTTEAADIVTSDADTVMLAGGGNATLVGGIDRVELHTLGGGDLVDLDLQLAGVEKFIDAGDGNDLVDLSGSIDATILGGSGDDILIGSPLADLIIGGDGDDNLQGGAGSDRLEGGSGRDFIQGGTGTDEIFGGDDADEITWNNGDGDDTVEGGQGNDLLIVNGDVALGENFVLRPLFNPPPTGPRVVLERTNLTPFQLNTDDIEAFEIQAGGGADTLIVQDLFETDARTVFYVAGVGADADSLVVHARNTDDALHLNNTAGILTVEGLTYDVAMGNGNAANGDMVTINGNDGNDTIEAGPGTELLALLTFNGGAGNDTLLGSAGNDALNGGDGEDTISGNGGIDSVHGGAGGDTIWIPGTSGNDGVGLIMTGAGGLVTNVNGVVTTYIAPGAGPIANASIAEIRFNGLAGDDLMTVDGSVGLVPIPITYHGEVGNDRLTVLNSQAVTATYNVGPDVGAGQLIHSAGNITQTINFTGLEPVVDLAPGTLTVNATDADNAVNYSQSELNATIGRVAVDGFESIHFSNKTTLTINAGAGSDAINLNNPSIPTGLTGITVNGGDPTAGSDTVVVNGTTGMDTINVGSLTSQGAVVTGAQPVPVTIATSERLVINGQGGSDDLTVTSPAGGSEISFRPGATADAGSVTHLGFSANSTLLPLDYHGLGELGSLTFDVAGGGRSSGLDVHGTSADDFFGVSDTPDGSVQVIKPGFGVPVTVPISTTGVVYLRLLGLDGDDTFSVPGNHPIPFGIEVQGGNPGSGSDTLEFISIGSTTVDLANSEITDAAGVGSPTASYSGIETVDLFTVGDVAVNLTVLGSDDDDRVEVTPLGPNSGTLRANGANPVVNFFNAATFTVDTLDGSDTLAVTATAGADAISVNNSTAVPTVTVVGREAVNHANVEAVEVYALQGADTITVTPGAANDIPVFIDGGDPIGVAPGDTLIVTANTSLVHTAGPENDEGGIVADGFEPVSFDHIESIVVSDPGGNDLDVTVCGTGDDDQITAQGQAPNEVAVQVNDGPIITYSGVATLTLEGKNGDDEFDIDINVPNLGVVFTVDGGLPNASDTLTVTGIDDDAADTVTWVPSTADSGQLNVVGNPINVVETEHVIYDGESDGDTVQVIGSGTFTHTPSAAFDFGAMQLRSGNQTMLGIAYENLGAGAVTAFGLGLSDTLVAEGTAGEDSINVAATTGTVVLTTSVGAHVPLQQVLIEFLEVNTLDGDDQITVNVPQPYQSVIVNGGSPGNSDVLTIQDELGADDEFEVNPGFHPGTGTVDINTGATLVPFTGIEHVLLLASNNQDTLTINDDLADNHWTVSAGPVFGDRVQIDNRESYDYDGFDSVELVNNFGTDTFQVHPTDLDGSLSLLITGAGSDALVAVGTPSGDLLSVAPGLGTEGTAVVNGVPVDFNSIASVVLQGGNGNDLFEVTPSINYQVFVDGGNPVGTTGDTLLLTANSLSIFTPGPEADSGGFEIDGLLPVTYDQVESIAVSDPVGDNLVAVVMGTQGDDDITAVGLAPNGMNVTVNDGAVVTYLGLADLTLQGKNGDDDIDIDVNVPNLGVRITVDGGLPNASDTLTVAGVTNDAADTVTWVPGTANSGVLTVAGQTIHVVETEHLIYDGESAGDTVQVIGSGTFTHTPGAAFDFGRMELRSGNETMLGIAYENLGAGAVTAFGLGLNDTLVAEGTASEDSIDVAATTGTVVLTTSVGAHVPLQQILVENLVIDALDGDDQITLNVPQPYQSITVNGGSPGNSDVLTVNDQLGANDGFEVTPGFSPGTGTVNINTGATLVPFTGIEHVLLLASSDQDMLTINDDLADNHWTVAAGPVFGDRVQIDNRESYDYSGFDSVELVNNFGTDTFEVHPTTLVGSLNLLVTGGGSDALVAVGTPSGDLLSVAPGLGTEGTAVVNGVPVDFNSIASVVLQGGNGNDLFDVTPSLNYQVFVDGGNPVGTTGDTLLLTADNLSIFTPGPESDSGGFEIDGLLPVTYDHIESIAVSDPGGNNLVAVVMGTQGDDDITAVGLAPNAMNVTVNDGAVVTYLGLADLTLQGKNGDDDIDIDVNVQGLGVRITADGGLPSTDPDVVTVTGVAGPLDLAVWTPASEDDGLLTLAGIAINIVDVERLILDGQNDSEVLTVAGGPGGDRFAHTPGAAVDAGSVSIENATSTLLGIDYVTLGPGGLVVIDGNGGSDTLAVRGTSGSDTMNVGFTARDQAVIDVRTSQGNHVDLVSDQVENYELHTFEGDDNVNLQATIDMSGTFTVNAGGPGGGSDTLNLVGAAGIVESVQIRPAASASDDQEILGLSSPNPIIATGLELITFEGVNDLDTLTVNPGSGDNAVRVERGSGADLVTSDSLPAIEFRNVNTFVVNADATAGQSGADVVTFVTRGLIGAVPANYQLVADESDTLVIEGVDGAGDDYTLTNPIGLPSVRVRDNAAAPDVLVTETSGNLGRLQVNTLGGDDRVLVDVNVGSGSDLIAVPITYDGGGNSDLLTISGTPAVQVLTVDYRPGPAVTEGRLTYNTSAMIIDFNNLEPVIDLVPAVNFIVNGTNAPNAITYDDAGANGLVTVDAYESIQFSNKTILTLNGHDGDDSITLNGGVLPAGLAQIVVNGGNSTHGDTLRVVDNNAGPDVVVSSLSSDGASITGAQFAPVIADTVERISIDGASSGDLLTVNTPAGSHTITYTPGPTPDSGDIRVDNFVPLHFETLDAGAVNFTNTGGGRSDVLVHRGSDVDDQFLVDAGFGGGRVVFENSSGVHVPVLTPGVLALTLEGLDGDDLFTVRGDHTYEQIDVRGGNPDDGDTLAVLAPNAPRTVDLGLATVFGYGGPIVYTGIQTIDANAGGAALNLLGTAGDDTITVTPLNATSGVAQANGADPIVRYSNTGGVLGATLRVNSLGGQDTLVVNASSLADLVEVDGPNQFVDTGANGGIVEFINANQEALTVNGLQGSDTFDVTPALTLSIFIDGGDPIGLVGDTLILQADNTSVYHAGPENDEGGFEIDGTPITSYDHIESIVVNDPGTGGNANDLVATVCGTHGDDDITAQGIATNVVDVTVNDGPTVRYDGVAELILEGKNGDDDIDIDIQVETLNVEFTADGGLPSVVGDTVTVTGVNNDAPDNVTWTPDPTSTENGTLVVDGETINVVNTESLLYDGEADGDNLSVIGGGRFVHTPGSTADAGRMALGSLLAIDYVNLGAAGTVTADGTSGGDTLVALGSNGSDTLDITLTNDDDIDIDLTGAAGTHVDLRSNNVESYEIRSLAGDDRINLSATFNVSGTFRVFAGDPGAGSDSFYFSDPGTAAVGITPDGGASDNQLVSGVFTGAISLSGVELIHYDGNASDTLTVNPGAGDNSVTVRRGTHLGTDQVNSDSLPTIEFEGVNTFLVDASAQGSDTVTFVTWFLTGAVNANYQMSGSAVDTLVIQGSDGAGAGNDSFRITNPAGAAPVAVRDNNGTQVTVTAINASQGRLQINTLGGDDTVTIDVGGTNVIPTPITFDGGSNSDLLILQGNPLSPTAAVYSPGAAVTEGRLQYFEASVPPVTMTVDFANLEPVIDTINGTLTVNGTDASNQIDYRRGTSNRGLVSVDGFELIEFANKTSLTLSGGAGDDKFNLNNQGTAPAGLTSITVQGGNSTTGDELVVNGTTLADNIGFEPTAFDSARVTGVQSVAFVDAFTIENVVLNGLGDANATNGDVLTVFTPDGTPANPVHSSVEVTPGTTFDSGRVQVDTLVPMRFLNLSTIGSLNVSDPDAFDHDRVIYNGGETSDTFVVPDPRIGGGTPSIAKVRFVGSVPFLQIPVTSSAIENYTLRGASGNDTFDIRPLAGVNIRVEGDDPAAGSDTLNFDAAAASVNLDLETGTLAQAGFGDVVYTGIEDLNIDANGQNLNTLATGVDDVVEVTPLGTNSGLLQSYDAQGNDTSPVVNFRETGTFNLDTAGGQNRIIVNGTTASETIAADGDSVTVGTRETVNYTSTGGGNALTVNGHEGSDTFNVTPSPSVPIFIDGGDPIGITGDRLNVQAENSVLYHAGPENDEGGIEADGNQIVSFDHIEAVSITDPAGPGDPDLEVTICATHADDDITAWGVATNVVNVTINDGPIITLNGVTDLILEGKNGDDDIDIDVQVPNLGVEITADGGLPSTTGDEVTVTGVANPLNPDAATWEPLDVDAGTLTVTYLGNPVTINIVNTETLTYDGESHDETLTVIGDGSIPMFNNEQERFIHTPGRAPDAGRVDIITVDTNPISSNDTLLGINYVNLGLDGSVTIDGNSSAVPQGDTLVLHGTDGDDRMSVDFTADNAATFALFHAFGPHVRVFSQEVENYEVRMLAGDDIVELQAEIAADGTFTVHGGGPGNSDVLRITGDPNTAESVRISPDPLVSIDQWISGLSPNPMLIVGIERISYQGVNDQDTLTVDPGPGDNQVFVERGNNADLVTSDSLPPIEFDNLSTFVVDAATGGADRVTFATWNLRGAINSNYQMTGSGIDTLIIEGVDGGRDGNDRLTVTNPAGTPSVAVTDNNGANVTVTATTANLGRLQINTLGGDDQVLVDVGSTDLVNVPITFDGGGNSDLLTISGTPATTVTNVVYSPGASVTEGRLTYDSAMTIDFLNLEPIIDLVPAANLTVNGTNAANQIDYRQGSVAARGEVSVDGFEVIEFSLKDQLTINGNAGDDTINLDNATYPTGNLLAVLNRVVVNGGGSTTGDKVIVNGSAAADSLTFLPLAPDAADVTGAQATNGVDINTTELVVINGLGSNDRLDVRTPAGANTVTYSPAATVDAGNVRVDSLVPLDFVNLGATGVLGFDDASGTRVDTLVHRASDVNDLFHVAATTGYVTLTNSPGTHVLVETDGVRNLTLNGLGGDDIFTVDGLHPYLLLEVQGQEPSASDVLNVNGTAAAETIRVNLEPATITGLGTVPGESIRFTGIEHVNIDGGGGTGGSDTLTVVGTQDDDILTYEPLEAEDGKFRNEGSNTGFVFRNIGGNFTVDGGADGADKVILLGTNDHDVIVINSPSRVASVEDTFGVVLKPVNLATTVEVLNAQARDGNDTFLVVPAPPLSSSVDGIPRNLLIDVDGGAPSASDALVIARIDGTPLANTDFVVVSHSRRFDEGVIRVYRDATGVVGDQVVNALITPPVRFPDIGYTNVEIVDAKVSNPATNRLILGPDIYEQNEALTDATFVGSGQTLNLENLAIFPPRGEHRFVDVDQDWYRFVAQSTGTLDFQVYFHEYSPELLPQGGNLHIEVYDEDGDLIAGYGPNFGTNDENQGLNPLFVRDDNERIRIPAVAGQTYYLRVFGPDDPTVDPMLASRVVNGYSLTVINTPPTVPYDLELVDIIGQSTVAASPASSTTTVYADPTMAQSLVQEDDFYNGKYLYFISGQQAARRALITDYDYSFSMMTGERYQFTLDGGWLSAAPAIGDSFVIESHDTGRSQLDNVTRDDTPVIRFRLDDAIFLSDLPGNSDPNNPPDEVIPIPFNADQTQTTSTPGYRVPVFIEGPPQSISGPLPQVPVGYARMLAQGVYEFDFGQDAIDLAADPTGNTLGAFSLEANNGSYFLSAKVEIDDPADPTEFGFGDRSVSLEIIVDTQPPLLFFGDPQVADDGLMAGSDSGVAGYPNTFTDEVTNVTNPWFWGTAEANALVQLWFDQNANGVVDGADVRIAQTVAIPLDGTNQYPSGQWSVQSSIDLNDPQYFAEGGVRRILATAEDVAGNVTSVASLDIFIDTEGPIVTSVFVTTAPGYDLFDPKPSTDGPTPPVTSLSITVRDWPARSNLDPDFLYPALLEAVVETPGNIRLVGDHSGVIAIDTIDFVSNPVVNGQPATGTIILTFTQPLPDDRFTLTIFDNVVDPVGNRLDGETDTIEPEDDPRLPSGDGQPGGDFIARFTIDSRPEIATVCCGGIYVDANGNLIFDPEGQDNDATNRDLVFSFGLSSDAIFAGNFAPAGATSASGFDKLGAYGYVGGQYRFLLDFDHDGVPDFSSVSHWQVNGIPVAGDFAPSHPGDEIGLFDGTRWYLDTNGNNILDPADQVINSSIQGLPIVGDFDGNGTDDLGTFAAGVNTFYLDLNRDGAADRTVNFGFAGIHERPVTGDLNLDGVDDLGLWVPGRAGQIPREAAEWYFLVSDSASGQFDPYSPAPLGNDIFAQFGDEFALPLFGNFDPPVTDSPEEISLTNPDNAYDTNMDGRVTPVDVLVVINWLNAPPSQPTGVTRPDVTADKRVAPNDALSVINYLNVRGAGEGEGLVGTPQDGLTAASVEVLVTPASERDERRSAPARKLLVVDTVQVAASNRVSAAGDAGAVAATAANVEQLPPRARAVADRLFADAQLWGTDWSDVADSEADSDSGALLGLLADDVTRAWLGEKDQD